ncbi:MAG: thioesterase [Staphylococcus sp.]|nr:thioesterase [Staphylococcus sp.]
MSTESKIFSYELFLPASEVNAQREMPLSRIVTTIIDVATAHANRLGIGFDRMIQEGISWVLSRLTIDIMESPAVNHTYRIDTWVENTNRLFSDRNFAMFDAKTGEEVLRAHSTWMAINMTTRRPGDLTPIWEGKDIVLDRPFGGDKGGKLLPLTSPETEHSYRFAVSDIDVNRHVTTRRYIDLMTDLWSLDHYERNRIGRFEVAFKHEAQYDEEATVGRAPHEGSPEVADIQIAVNSTPCCLSRIHFIPR